MSGDLFERATDHFRGLQTRICAALEQLEQEASSAARPAAAFSTDSWERDGGGGGVSRVLAGGALFEKAGVNWSMVEGELPEAYARELPGEGTAFRAAGVSLVLHPASPMVPTTHANFRCLEKGDTRWFGGGADLTPYYLFREDAVHFHRTLRAACDRHAAVADYQRFKTWCDQYFYLPHRDETRGVGGIFFDYLQGDAAVMERTFAFVQDAGEAFLDAYLPIARRRCDEPWGASERNWQLLRRGRYVEFNLLYDRGTVFGLRTKGRTESILMSLPPFVKWEYCFTPASHSREAELLAALKPQDWVQG
jgi:coproporphyrinogen III oxidase